MDLKNLPPMKITALVFILIGLGLSVFGVPSGLPGFTSTGILTFGIFLAVIDEQILKKRRENSNK